MFCNFCGAQIPNGSRVCSNCGASLNQNSQQGNDQKFSGGMNQSFNQVDQSYNQDNYGYSQSSMRYGVERLQTDRSLGMYILLTIVTLGIYSYYFIYKMAHDVNIACEGDGQKTSGLGMFILLSIITCGIYSWIWEYNLGNRLSQNAPRYGLTFMETGTTVLMWLIFGSLLCGIGYFVAMNILIKNSNTICMAYNRNHGF